MRNLEPPLGPVRRVVIILAGAVSSDIEILAFLRTAEMKRYWPFASVLARPRTVPSAFRKTTHWFAASLSTPGVYAPSLLLSYQIWPWCNALPGGAVGAAVAVLVAVRVRTVTCPPPPPPPLLPGQQYKYPLFRGNSLSQRVRWESATPEGHTGQRCRA